MSNAHSRGNGVNPKAGGWASAGTKTAVAHNIGARKTRQNPSFARAVYQVVDRRNARSVWTIASEPSADPLHFAAFPRELPLRCILAGCPPGGVVMDPFSGTGTTGVAALETGRGYVGIEVNAETAERSRGRLAAVAAQGDLFNS